MSATLALAGDVAFEHLMRSEECDFFFALAVLAEFFRCFGESLTVHQGFRLSKEVREELLVMIADLVVAVCRGDEVTRNHLGALVNELVEGVLAVRTRFTPEDRTCLIVNALGIAIHSLTVGFHVCLLEVSGQAVQILVVREHGIARSAKEVVVPDADEGEDHRKVLVCRSGLEMLIHFISALMELHIVVEADAESDRKYLWSSPHSPCGSGYIARRSVRTCGTPAPLLQRHHSAASRGHYP